MAIDQQNRSETLNDPEKHDHTNKVIAVAFFKSWEKLPPRSASMLAHVLPVLINRASEDPLAVGVALPDDQPADPETDQQKEFKSLARTARRLHRARVQCLWWWPNVDYRPGQTYLRHTVELAWTTEVRVNPTTGRIELIFWEGLRQVLPHLARMAGFGDNLTTGEFDLIAGEFDGTVVEVADHESLELYLHKNRR